MFYISILFAIVIDQASKFFLKSGFSNFSRVNIFSDWFYIQSTHNTWVAFSFPIEGLFLKILTLILIWTIFIYYFKYEPLRKQRLIQIGFWCILWWAISNAIERLFVWHVLDFIGVKYFAIFNFADIFITIWAVILFLVYFGIWKTKQ